jgi:hypothetical protein
MIEEMGEFVKLKVGKSANLNTFAKSQHSALLTKTIATMTSVSGRLLGR